MANHGRIEDSEEIGFLPNRDGYLRFDNQSIPVTNIEKLKYPRDIDPYKIRCEILFTVISCLMISVIFALTFLYLTFQNKSPLFLHGYLCGLILASFLMLIGFIIKSRSWLRFIRNSGYYYYPKFLETSAMIGICTWSIGIFFFSIPLIFEQHYCHVANLNPRDSCLNLGNINLTGYNLLQCYIAIATFVTILSLLYYLSVLVRFRIQRRWPDIWHERLLEESQLLESCPLILNHVLRIDNQENSVSVSSNRRLPTEADIMKIQAYVIKYLRQLNNKLSRRIFELENKSTVPIVNYGSTLVSDTRERQFEPSIE